VRIIDFYRAAYDDNARRRREDRHSILRDAGLYLRNMVLRPREKRLVDRFHRPDAPICFIVGAPRSGTTLLHQLITQQLDVGYISNFVARYWMAPLCGFLAYQRRFPQGPTAHALTSRLGVAHGIHAPHEFSWFWRYWVPFPICDQLTDDELAALDWTPALHELGALAGWLRRPLVLKNLNHVDFHTAWLAQRMPGARFVWIERDAPFVLQSILLARKRRYNNDQIWWSVRPLGFEDWAQRSPEEQVVFQYEAIEASLAVAARAIPERFLRVSYETLTSQPRRTLQRIAVFAGAAPRDNAVAMDAIKDSNEIRLPRERWDRLVALLRRNEAVALPSPAS
jgi:hypothetical protein